MIDLVRRGSFSEAEKLIQNIVTDRASRNVNQDEDANLFGDAPVDTFFDDTLSSSGACGSSQIPTTVMIDDDTASSSIPTGFVLVRRNRFSLRNMILLILNHALLTVLRKLL